MKLEDLTPEQREKLHADFLAQEAAKKQKIKDNKITYKSLAEEFVHRNIDPLIHHKEITGFLIDATMDDFKAIKELKAEVYGLKKQDSHTTTLKDGSASISIGQNIVIKFDGTETAGIEKIKDYMKSLSGDSESAKKLVKIVDKKLKIDPKSGGLNPSAIIDLDTLRDEFNSDLFSEGLDIIKNAQIRTVTSKYVSGYKIIPIDEERSEKLEFRFTI
jgi:hypothetical protein